MTFPETSRVVYRKNPLENVICQLRYPPILRIDSEVPSQFQEAIRTEYPLYKEMTEFRHAIAAGVKPQGPQEVAMQLTGSSKNYVFSNEEETRRINLTRTFFSMSTSDYHRWENFVDKLRNSYDRLQEIYSPPFFTRIGLRYVNVFERSELGLDNVDWKELLRPCFLGLLSSSVANVVKSSESTHEIELSDKESMVRIKTSLVINENTSEYCYMVDSDFFTQKKIPPQDVLEKLDFLNCQASNLIQWTMTPKLHNAMEPQKI